MIKKKSKTNRLARRNKYRSIAEKDFAKVLDKYGYTYQYEPFTLPFEIVEHRTYKPDFVLFDEVIIEFKGIFTSDDRKKMLAVRKAHPYYDIRFVFMKDNWLTSSHKRRYSDWAKENGFKYHVGISLPKEWIEEFK